jgi:hypothetical protein
VPETALAQAPANVVHRLKNRNLLSLLSTTRTLVGNGVGFSRVNDRRMETAEHFFAPPLVDRQALAETQRTLVKASPHKHLQAALFLGLNFLPCKPFQKHTCQIPDDMTLGAQRQVCKLVLCKRAVCMQGCAVAVKIIAWEELGPHPSR